MTGPYYIDRIIGEDEISPLSEVDTLIEARAHAKEASLDPKWRNFPVGIFTDLDTPTYKEAWVNGTKRTVQETERIIKEG